MHMRELLLKQTIVQRLKPADVPSEEGPESPPVVETLPLEGGLPAWQERDREHLTALVSAWSIEPYSVAEKRAMIVDALETLITNMTTSPPLIR